MEMQFRLTGYFRTSADLSAAADDVETFFRTTAVELMKRGVPDGRGAVVSSVECVNDCIHFTVVSDRYARAHDAVLRLRKPLAALIGKKYRIGIRKIEIDSYIISFPSKKPLKNKIPYVKNIEYTNEQLILSLNVGEAEIENRVPDRIISLIEDKIRSQEYGGKAEHWNLLWQSEKKQHKNDIDPTNQLLDAGWIKRGASRGQWIHGPQITKLFRVFEQIVLNEIIAPLDYKEMIFPKLVTWEVWEHSGHAKGVYPEIYYVCPPKTRDPEFWEEVIDHYKVTLEVPIDMIAGKIDKPIGGMCYAQCPPFWMFLKGETIADSSFPIKVFDRSGTSHRYESGGIHGIERVDEFHRIELVWCGTIQQVLDESKKLQECYKRIFNDMLELEWRTAWVTPWFMAQEGLTGLSEQKEVGTIDYEAVMPYRDDWLEFQNLSVNGDKYPGGFNVKSQSKEQLWSGCSGIGLERWASALLAQKGLNIKDWPDVIQDMYGEMPEGIKFL
ncbi:MAG: Type-2 serine--tRNA ligase [Candidatus Argoarchaeum ethanivorans]|uniref:Type-2 serine--tRNA ligase n=1 Tax=Candidatus Argoarchaeum ethanivorans TaxID=2608793 RepID=A0A811TFE1_9EURY|nr:MAG: Type-2 serine--tRNA ligase [Candidatus Argoarchaeum ethanivorans]